MYEKMDRVTVAEAAARLGLKEQAIRKRVQRGTLAHDKDDDGRVYVYLDPKDGDTGMGTLFQSLQNQIAYLRQEAEDWKEGARRKDTILRCFPPLILRPRPCFTTECEYKEI